MVVGMNITFLGTSSAQPSMTRNHQSMALRVDGDIWLFDCGEATQHQFQKSSLKMGRITKIFITHMHGDHCFGLGPLMCSMTDNLNPEKKLQLQDATQQEQPPIDVYGPARLRRWLRTTLSSTYSNLGRYYRVHEILGPEEEESIDDPTHFHPQELLGTTVRLTPAAVLDVGRGFTVTATAIKHSIPSLGFVIQEPDVMGKLDRDTLVPQLLRNAEALFRQQGIKQPLVLLGRLQREGKPIQLPDGTWLNPPDKKQGRQVVILGDTCDPSSIIPYCQSPHLLVHEATNAWTSLDRDNLATTEALVEERAVQHGHSTPQMAGDFALRIGARTLILTHFSARYKGDDSEDGIKVMEEIRQLALARFGKDKDTDLYCARDLWSFEIKHR
ncbi:beta-lactamase-like protein [Halteromyces radiatus]|uniref:beta-lactamase-like protein n=1 Tax=Halteromyces radiatus TaxID=101107 RepID=UPI00221EB134|nr:beta-lactamase-like protein [Halteromyces radiatus]KAI8097382.1 beta-lactamase-like protein [Halteromyces radiatus]